MFVVARLNLLCARLAACHVPLLLYGYEVKREYYIFTQAMYRRGKVAWYALIAHV